MNGFTLARGLACATLVACSSTPRQSEVDSISHASTAAPSERVRPDPHDALRVLADDLQGWTRNPVALLRAAESLRPLGKDGILAVLSSLDIGQGEGVVVEVLIALLFDHDSRPRRPTERSALDDAVWQELAIRAWFPDYPVFVPSGIPFSFQRLPVLAETGGSQRLSLGRDTREFIEFARASGSLRNEPLEPAGNPLEVVEALHGDRHLRGVLLSLRSTHHERFPDDVGNFYRTLRMQACVALEGILDEVLSQRVCESGHTAIEFAEDSGPYWTILIEVSRDCGVCWNERTFRYETTR